MENSSLKGWLVDKLQIYKGLISTSSARRTSPTSKQLFLNVGKSKTTSVPIHIDFLCTTSYTL